MMKYLQKGKRSFLYQNLFIEKLSGRLVSNWHLTLFLVLFIFCSSMHVNGEPAADKSQPDILLLMHNPSGIRIEYNISKHELELWISPQAGEEDGYWMRNFSNRDDHTRLFDKISFPELNPADYLETEYNPWHSIVHYKNQKLHIATVFDEPYLVVWFENEGIIDFKSDKQDSIVKRDNNTLHIHHPDRGLEFSFVALLNEGHFQHQLQTDRGRSTYARAHLKSGKPLYIGGELSFEPVEKMLQTEAKKPVEEVMEKTSRKVDELLAFGRVVFRDHDSLQYLVDFNKRIWASSQDHSGALHASIKYIYYLIWVREGGLACPWIGYSGWVHPLEKWMDFQIKNSTKIQDEGPGGRFFGQLVNGKITKWQEDGEFFAIWPAYTHWTQTGKNTFVSGENLNLLRESVDWLERYCFDPEKGIFYRYYYCETPLHNSRDFGWDNAVGKPVLGWDPAPYKGHKIEKSYDIYINLLNYSVYKMLEAMCNAEGIENDYATKAASLAKKMKFMFEVDDLPLYGKVISTEGKTITAEKYGMDETDYIWALTCPPFYPDYVDINKYRLMLFDDLLEKRDGYFLAAYFSILGSLDLTLANQSDVRKSIEYAARECYIPWENLPMAGSMVEMSGYYPPGDAHQIRPQMFTMGAWFGAMGNLGVRRLPFGLAIQPAEIVNGIEKYEYQNRLINFNFSGEGNTVAYSINGEIIKGSLQIPENKLTAGTNKIDVTLSNAEISYPLLVSSTLKLLNIEEDEEKMVYQMESFNQHNTITLSQNRITSPLQIKNEKGKVVKFKSKKITGNRDMISFTGKGNFTLEIRK